MYKRQVQNGQVRLRCGAQVFQSMQEAASAWMAAPWSPRPTSASCIPWKTCLLYTSKPFTDDDLTMIPVYIGVGDEANQGLCTGTEN